jgi:hypothetical protein
MPAANVGMCRSQIVNNDIARSFWEKPGGALLSLGVCASGEINDKYINGSLYGKIVSIKQTPKKNNDFFYINICDQL